MSSKCREDYIDYENDSNGKAVITNYYISSEYGYHSIVRSFLGKFTYDDDELSDESLIKYKDIFTKSEDCIRIIKDMIRIKKSKNINIKLFEEYFQHLNMVEFINQTETQDEKIYALIASNKLVDNNKNREIYRLKILNIDLFDRYLKSIFYNDIKNWSDWNYTIFFKENNNLTYDNFYKNYLDIFVVKELLTHNIDVPIEIVENYLVENEEDSEDICTIIENYSSKFTENFISDNIIFLNKFLVWSKVTLNMNALIKLEECININIFDCYNNNENIFPTKKTIEYIQKYINIEDYIYYIEQNVQNVLVNNKWDDDDESDCYSDLAGRISILKYYKYLNEDLKYSLRLMAETVYTCARILNEYKGIIESGINIKEARQNVSDIYLKKIYELKELFNDIKNDI